MSTTVPKLYTPLNLYKVNYGFGVMIASQENLDSTVNIFKTMSNVSSVIVTEYFIPEYTVNFLDYNECHLSIKLSNGKTVVHKFYVSFEGVVSNFSIRTIIVDRKVVSAKMLIAPKWMLITVTNIIMSRNIQSLAGADFNNYDI